MPTGSAKVDPVDSVDISFKVKFGVFLHVDALVTEDAIGQPQLEFEGFEQAGKGNLPGIWIESAGDLIIVGIDFGKAIGAVDVHVTGAGEVPGLAREKRTVKKKQ